MHNFTTQLLFISNCWENINAWKKMDVLYIFSLEVQLRVSGVAFYKRSNDRLVNISRLNLKLWWNSLTNDIYRKLFKFTTISIYVIIILYRLRKSLSSVSRTCKTWSKITRHRTWNALLNGIKDTRDVPDNFPW